MKINIGGIKIFKSNVYEDHRGFFKEVYKKKELQNKQLIFHCASTSKKNVLRGLHMQIKNPQAKFLTVIKGGFIFAPKIGTGLVISKFKNNYWSPPSAIGTIGISYGAIIGAEITDYLIFLNDDDALNSFTSDKQLSFGAGIDIAIGNIGRSGMIDINISDKGSCTLLSYSQSRGFLAGASLDGSIISTRNDVNHKFYGRKLSSKELLSGILNDGTYINPLPKAAQPLYDALNKILYIMLHISL